MPPANYSINDRGKALCGASRYEGQQEQRHGAL